MQAQSRPGLRWSWATCSVAATWLTRSRLHRLQLWLWCSSLRGHLPCTKIFAGFKKKVQTYPFSRNVYLEGRNISSEAIFFCVKIEWEIYSRSGQFGGPTWHLFYGIQSTCYSLWNSSMRLVLVWTELFDLELCCISAQTRPVSLHPPIHPMLP